MIYYLIALMLIKVNICEKILYSNDKLDFVENNEPIIWDLKNKNIDNEFTLTFLFKYTSAVSDGDGVLSFGYYESFFHNINFYKNMGNNYSLKLGEYRDNRNLNVIINKYYYILLYVEIEQIVNYKTYQNKTTLKFGDEYEKSFNIINKSLSNRDLENFIINVGSNFPQENSKFRFSIENITFYNWKLNDNEIKSIILGDSKSLVFIDFANSITFSQYYYNKLNTNYIGGINGNSINNDEFDLFTDYNKLSNNLINKKIVIFKTLQYITLSPMLSNIYSLKIFNNWVYLKLSIHLNDSNTENNINSDFYIYNINNKTGINIKLISINISTEKFKIELGLIENNTLNKSIISTNNTLNFDFLILIYEKQENSMYKIKLNYKVNNNYDSIEFINNNPPISTDQHYLGSITSTNSLIFNYILIELEEFMFGKGSYINININENIIYDNIVLYCHNLTNNKIIRNNNLNSCNIRSDNITLEINNCEYVEDSNCIFRLSDNIDTIGRFPYEILKPYRQKFNSFFNSYLFTNINSSSFEYVINYVRNYTINNNLLIEITFDNRDSLFNISGNIFQITVLSVDYSFVCINKDKNLIVYSLEIFNNINLLNPNILIRNLSLKEFKISKLNLLEMNYNIIDTQNERFIGEKLDINSNYILLRNKPYANIATNVSTKRNTGGLFIFCSDSCLNSCTGPDDNNCIGCKNNYINRNGCIKINALNCSSFNNNPSFCDQCGTNYLPIRVNINGVLCICHNSCKTCNGSNHNNCTSCHKNYILYYNNICRKIIDVSKCYQNYILKPKDNLISGYIDKCLKCTTGCNLCRILDLNYCINCLKGFHLFNNTCIRCLDDGRFIDFNILDSNNQPICQNCHTSCKTCYNNSNSGCLSCYTNKYLLENNSLKSCNICNDDGYYIENKKCKICDINCLTCIKNSKYCLSCKSFFWLDNIKYNCVINCNSGTYRIENNCYKCHNTCKTCSNSGQFTCIKCSNNLFYNVLENKCEACLKINYVKIGDKCFKCHINCLKCTGIYKNNCIFCNNNWVYNELTFECLNKCPSNSYLLIINNIKICRKYFYGCLECINYKKDSCIKCIKNYLYNKYTNKCLKICEKGYFKLNEYECEKCNEKCTKCISLNTCIKCKKGFYLWNYNLCSLKKIGYYIFNNKLFNCNINCKNCIDYNNCITCKPNTIMKYNFLNKTYYCALKCKNNDFFYKIKK